MPVVTKLTVQQSYGVVRYFISRHQKCSVTGLLQLFYLFKSQSIGKQLIIFKNSRYSMNYQASCNSPKTLCCSSSESESSSDRQQDHYVPKTNPLKHKTEMCKTYSELGYCPYNSRCRFAHGYHELVGIPTRNSYRKRKCKGFWSKGFCAYGTRCQFRHTDSEWETEATLFGLETVCEVEKTTTGRSKLLSLLCK